MERILAIDDTRIILKSLESILQSAGYDCATAPDGSAGLVLTRTFLPDLVLLDAEMPGISGFEVCANLKSHPDTMEIPVIFLSGHNDLEHRVKAFEAGAQDFIAKPFHEREVILRIETQLKIRRSQRELIAAKDAATDANKAKSVFLSRMSHELKTPLNSIIGYSRLMGHSDLSEAQTKDRLQIIQVSGEQLLNMVDELIVFAELESDKANLHPMDVELHPFIQSLCRDFETQSQHIQLDFQYALNLEFLQGSHIDVDMFRLLFQSLLRSNRCSPASGYMRLNVASQNKNTHSQLSIDFRTYHGKSSDFVQADTRLELSLSQKILTLLNGSMRIEHPEMGWTFIEVMLPIPYAKNCSQSLPEGKPSYDLWIQHPTQPSINTHGIPVLQGFPRNAALSHYIHAGKNRWLIDADLAIQHQITPQGFQSILPLDSELLLDGFLDSSDPYKELALYHLGFSDCGSLEMMLAKTADQQALNMQRLQKPKESLQSLSTELKHELYFAAHTLDSIALEAIAQKIQEEEPELSTWIRTVCHNFSFEQIEKNLEEIK